MIKASLDLFLAALVFGAGFTLSWCIITFAWAELVQALRKK